MFETIVSEAQEKFNLGDKAGSLLSYLLGLIADPANGGFGGFIRRFHDAHLGDLADSWITTGDNTSISGGQLESALGADSINTIAGKAGVDSATATSALAFMTPHVVDALTPRGEVPVETSLLSTVGTFQRKHGAADLTAATTGSPAGAFGKASGAADSSGDEDSGGILRWLIPILLLAFLVVLCIWFFGKSTPLAAVTTKNTSVNKAAPKTETTVKTIDSNFKIEAKGGKYIVSGVVPDQKTLDEIKARLTAEFGEGNVDFAGLKVDPNARIFAAGWWDNFSKLLPGLKGWKDGTLSFAGNSVTSAGGLPQAAIDQIKLLFAGWTLPVSIAGEETATKQANEEALKELSEAGSVEEVLKALNVSIINFESNKADIPADAKPILEKAAAVLSKQSEGTAIEIGGYTDNKGNADGNKKLSQSRADAVKKALVALGVKDAMLKAVGYGDANPVGDNNTEDGRFKNRRIEYKKSDVTAPTSVTKTTVNTNSLKTNANAAK